MIIGIGVDLIEINRIEKIFKRWGNTFSRKILSKKELLFFSNYIRSPSRSKAITYLAKRFSAKEAIVKALGIGMRYPANFQSIEILNDFYGRPYPVFSNNLKKFCEQKKYTLHLSITDQKNYAQAFAVVEVLEKK